MKFFIHAACVTISGQTICDQTEGFDTLGDLINLVVSFVVPIAGIILFLVLVAGGYSFMMSQGNPEKVKKAQGMITAGIVGFILLVASYFIVKLLSTIFGLGQGII